MKTCEYDGEPFSEPRSHPWTGAIANPASRYYDFKTDPELIRTALEDFLPWGHDPAVTVLYELLERLNARTSILESNDCAFSGPHESEAPQWGKLQCDGRVMILYRELELNLSQRGIEDRLETVRDEVQSRVEMVKDAVDSGKDAARSARTDLEGKLERSKAAYRAGIAAARDATVEGEAEGEESA